MSKDFKGSKPGPLPRNNSIDRTLNPTTSPDTSGTAPESQCPRRQSHNYACPVDVNENDRHHEQRSVELPDSPRLKPTTTYPEGGFQAWLVVAGSFSGMVRD